MSWVFLIIPPLSLELISIHILVVSRSFSFALFYMSLIKLVVSKLNIALTFNRILRKISLVFYQLVPSVYPFSLFLWAIKWAFKIISVFIEYFTVTFDLIILPKGLYFSPVWEIYTTNSLFLSIRKISSKNSAIFVKIGALATLLAFNPHSIITLAIWVVHFAVSMFHVIKPIPFIDIAIWIVILSFTLLPILYHSLKTLVVFEDVCAPY